MVFKFCALILCFLALLNGISCVKVLLVFPFASYSHHNLGSKLMHALVTKENEVTLISSFKEGNIPKSCRHILIEETKELMEERSRQTRGFTSPSFEAMDLPMEIVEKVFADSDILKLVNDTNEKFDVVVVDETMCQAMRVFAYHFNAPLVIFSSLGPASWISELVGNPHPWSYIPNSFHKYTSHMNMWQRINNVLFDAALKLYTDFRIIPSMDVHIDKYFPGAPHIKELATNISVVLLNSHVSTNSPVPMLPNMIEIGGYHVDPPKKLPEDLQNYLDRSVNGAVYFSMGSIFKGEFFDENLRSVILNTFSKLSLNVLWKFENDTILGKPGNVKIVKWVPQNDVLAHPNVKLFISHGGLLSTIEAVYHGVPILGIPAFADQIANIATAASKGYAVQLSLDDLSEETFSAALHDILNNPKYFQSIKQRQKLMFDRQVSPKETAVYWIEYAARHKGERHFRSAALDLAWYELYMIDALIFVIFVILALTYLTVQVMKYCVYRIRKHTTKIKVT